MASGSRHFLEQKRPSLFGEGGKGRMGQGAQLGLVTKLVNQLVLMVVV